MFCALALFIVQKFVVNVVRYSRSGFDSPQCLSFFLFAGIRWKFPQFTQDYPTFWSGWSLSLYPLFSLMYVILWKFFSTLPSKTQYFSPNIFADEIKFPIKKFCISLVRCPFHLLEFFNVKHICGVAAVRFNGNCVFQSFHEPFSYTVRWFLTPNMSFSSYLLGFFDSVYRQFSLYVAELLQLNRFYFFQRNWKKISSPVNLDAPINLLLRKKDEKMECSKIPSTICL